MHLGCEAGPLDEVGTGLAHWQAAVCPHGRLEVAAKDPEKSVVVMMTSQEFQAVSKPYFICHLFAVGLLFQSTHHCIEDENIGQKTKTNSLQWKHKWARSYLLIFTTTASSNRSLYGPETCPNFAQVSNFTTQMHQAAGYSVCRPKKVSWKQPTFTSMDL